jgi:GT2 family glycosyltransferase
VEIQNQNPGGNIVFNQRLSLKGKIKSLLLFFCRKKAAYVNRFGILSDFTGTRTRYADTGIGCNMSFKKEVFLRCGFFDDNYTGNAYREDTDMAIRVRKAGYAIIYSPEAALIHHMDTAGGSRNAGSMDYWLTYFKNLCYFYLKNFNSSKLLLQAVLFFDLLRCKKNGLPAFSVFNRAYIKAKHLISV